MTEVKLQPGLSGDPYVPCNRAVSTCAQIEKTGCPYHYMLYICVCAIYTELVWVLNCNYLLSRDPPMPNMYAAVTNRCLVMH